MSLNSLLISIRIILERLRQAFKSQYFGFICGHSYLEPTDLYQLELMVGTKDESVVAKFEQKFAQIIGQGDAISYAAARMGFYELLNVLKIGKGDEVILLGSTCAVMASAVLRTGATPIYADIDPDTFGSSCKAIEVCITSRTRMIVAQHSFGIPCDVEPIANLAKLRGIFLLEDCALTLGSQINGKVVGNFGDAALFSTDHSKPINTLIGGIIYTNNKDLSSLLRISQEDCQELSVIRQKALWRRLLLEAKFFTPERFGLIGIIELYLSLKRKIILTEGDFLVDDFGLNTQKSYPYPAKMPTFLAALGLIEVMRWPQVANERKLILTLLLNEIDKSKLSIYISPVYKNKTLEIIPLRFVWSQPNGILIRNKCSSFINVTETWFMSPVVASKFPLQTFGYYVGSCPISERLGPGMVNIPCTYDKRNTKKLINRLLNIYN